MAGGIVVYDKILSKDKTPDSGGGIGDEVLVNESDFTSGSTAGGTLSGDATIVSDYIELTKEIDGVETIGGLNYDGGSSDTLGTDYTFEYTWSFSDVDPTPPEGARINFYYTVEDPSTFTKGWTNASEGFVGYVLKYSIFNNTWRLIRSISGSIPAAVDGFDTLSVPGGLTQNTVYTTRIEVTGNVFKVYHNGNLEYTATDNVNPLPTGMRYFGANGETVTTYNSLQKVHSVYVAKNGVVLPPEEKKFVMEMPQTGDVDPHFRLGFGTEESLKVNRQGEVSVPKQLIRSYRQITTSETLTEEDYRVGCDHSSAIVVTLPLINDLTTEGKLCELTIFDQSGNASTNPITIQCSGSDTLNGQSSLVITGNHNSYSVFSAGNGQWFLA